MKIFITKCDGWRWGFWDDYSKRIYWFMLDIGRYRIICQKGKK